MKEAFNCPKDLGEKTKKLLEDFSSKFSTEFDGMKGITDMFLKFSNNIMQDPQKLVETQLDLYKSFLGLWSNMAEKMLDGEEVPDIIESSRGDKRFSGEAWDDNIAFDYIKQSYLLVSNWLTDTIAETEGMTKEEKLKTTFYTKQFLDALAPSNFPLTNPEVLEETIKSNGENLVKGLRNILDDLSRGKGSLRISMTDYEAFEVGKNLATTEGAVVFENELFQLIQYKPSGKQVHARPLVIASPWINRFYIMDLQKKNSFVKYAVDSGLTVFMISWKNPDESMRNTAFEDYFTKGILTAVDTAIEITGSKDVNLIGYCIAGTLSMMGLSALEQKGDKRINSITLFTTMLDFSECGDMRAFIDEKQIEDIEKIMAVNGFLPGRAIATSFSLLRSNDLIWSFVVNNYLLGKDPFPFDILYWNDDSTRVCEKSHSYYLRNTYLENNIVKPGKLQIMGEKVDLTKIKTPKYVLSALNDHIVLWKTSFKPMHTLGGETTFVVTKAGHTAGVVNPPGNAKRCYWAGDITSKDTDADKWFKAQTMQPDSWWPHWREWIKAKSDKMVDAKDYGSKTHKVIEQAPGRYVKEHYADHE